MKRTVLRSSRRKTFFIIHKCWRSVQIEQQLNSSTFFVHWAFTYSLQSDFSCLFCGRVMFVKPSRLTKQHFKPYDLSFWRGHSDLPSVLMMLFFAPLNFPQQQQIATTQLKIITHSRNIFLTTFIHQFSHFLTPCYFTVRIFCQTITICHRS